MPRAIRALRRLFTAKKETDEERSVACWYVRGRAMGELARVDRAALSQGRQSSQTLFGGGDAADLLPAAVESAQRAGCRNESVPKRATSGISG
jgi:hypothetical protein